MRGRHGEVLAVLLALAALGGCQRPSATSAPPTTTAAPGLRRTSQSGPVKATITLSPEKPRLGDPLVLELTVEAEPQVTVEMPPFGEALGRFSITSFTPREERLPGGGTRSSQRYQLEAPMSGKQRVPPLRVEFRDLRPQSAPRDADGGADELRELLTDELPIDIQSVLPAGQATAELRGLRDSLPELLSPGGRGLLLGGGGVVLLGGALLLARSALRRRRHVQRVNAYAAALARLNALAARGLPSAEESDGWYVELSGIVRGYLEERYGVRAPELTTEEFLREAQRVLDPRHREVLTPFLSTCDQVKFAGYRPAESESRRALEEARRFLDQTQPGGAP